MVRVCGLLVLAATGFLAAADERLALWLGRLEPLRLPHPFGRGAGLCRQLPGGALAKK
jgi:hypothetical protein